jgi:hypothetical protein
MTKRGVSAALVALVAMLAFAVPATADGAERLTYKKAKRLAVRLAEKQVAGRDIVRYHLVDADRRGRNKIVFAYDDRSEDFVYCTARVVVKRIARGERTVFRARFRRSECDGIPADARAFEAVTRATAREMRATEDATEASLRSVRRSINRCEDLEVPRSRRATVAAVIDIAIIGALAGPNDETLGEFVAALGQVDTSNAALQAGVIGWADYLDVLRSLPSIPDPCATLRSWAQADWSADQSPVDLEAYRDLDRRAGTDERAIAVAARYLARVGVFPGAVIRFTPEGMLLRLVPGLPASGGGDKIALRKPALF